MLKPDKTFTPPKDIYLHPKNVKEAIERFHERMSPEALEDYCYLHEDDAHHAFGNGYIASWVQSKRLSQLFKTLTNAAKKLSPHTRKILSVYIQEINKRDESGMADFDHMIDSTVLDTIFEPAFNSPYADKKALHHSIDDFLGFYNRSALLSRKSQKYLKNFLDKLTDMDNPTNTSPSKQLKKEME